ncbi:hypothetical protein J6590_047158 [Homalodisca vitripennis]|nr:hypothetical protein J6590_047158 [Homalodisca vitripennis]
MFSTSDDGYFTADAVLSKNRMYAGADQTVSANISWLPRVNNRRKFRNLRNVDIFVTNFYM